VRSDEHGLSAIEGQRKARLTLASRRQLEAPTSADLKAERSRANRSRPAAAILYVRKRSARHPLTAAASARRRHDPGRCQSAAHEAKALRIMCHRFQSSPIFPFRLRTSWDQLYS
jgi:Tfp pilus assembly protein PilV